MEKELKALQTRKKSLEIEIAASLLKLKDVNREHQDKVNKLNAIDKQIKQLHTQDIIISEHAILRYIERAMGLNLEQIKQEILSDKVKAQIFTLGSGKYPIGNKLKAVVKDNTIVTIVD